MKLAILGYGVEGKSVEKYFQTHPYENVPPEDIEIKVFDKFKNSDLDNLGLENFDVVFRSPSVRPNYDYEKYEKEDDYRLSQTKPYWTSATKYFFEHCPCEIIAVTGTKGKGTTASMIATILTEVNKQIFGASTRAPLNSPKVHLVGNIGVPPLDVFDEIESIDNIVFELSSFQLWDLHAGSYIGVMLRIEPDHLDVHKDFDEYVRAKSTVSRYKSSADHLIYFAKNETTKSLAENSKAIKHAYPIDRNELSTTGQKRLEEVLSALKIPGEHNRENAEAALLAVAARLTAGGDLDSLLTSELFPAVKTALANFEGLPHRLQFVRELNGVRYYDDNYSSAFPAMDVAIKSFENTPVILIAGGKNRNLDLIDHRAAIFGSPNVKKAILIGEIKEALSKDEDPGKFELADSLEEAVSLARAEAEKLAAGIDNCQTDDQTKHEAVVLMSPGAASFDMFDNFTDRGEKFQKIVKGLK